MTKPEIELGADVEDDQDDQFGAGRLRGQVVDEEEFAAVGGAVAGGRWQPDVRRQLVPEDVEEGDEDRELGDQRDAGGERVDFVLFVEAHHFLLHALFVVLVFRLDLLDLRLQRLQRPHPFQLFVGERDQHRPHRHGQGDDRHPPAEADVVVEELEDAVGDVDQRLQDVCVGQDQDARLPVVVGRMDVAEAAQGKPVRHRIEAAVAEGVAAQQAPGAENQAAEDAEALDRLDRVGRAGRLVAAAARAGRGDPALVGARSARGRSRFTWNAPRPLLASASSRLLATPPVPSRSIRLADLRLGDDDEVVAARAAGRESPRKPPAAPA